MIKEKIYENWLKNKLTDLYGKKCKDFEQGCACCQAWDIYETIIADRKGEI